MRRLVVPADAVPMGRFLCCCYRVDRRRIAQRLVTLIEQSAAPTPRLRESSTPGALTLDAATLPLPRANPLSTLVLSRIKHPRRSEATLLGIEQTPV